MIIEGQKLKAVCGSSLYIVKPTNPVSLLHAVVAAHIPL